VWFCVSSRRRHTSSKRDWSSDVCSSDLGSWRSLLVDDQGEHRINATGEVGYPFFGDLILGVLNRTENAMTQAHAFKAVELAIARSEERRVGKECRWRRAAAKWCRLTEGR